MKRDRGCQHVLHQRVGGACIFGDIMELVGSPGVGCACSANGRLNYEAACEMLENMPVPRAPCVSHKLPCQVPRPDLDISGSPCTPWSRMVGGTHLRRQHPLVATLVAWCRATRALGVPLALHENVVGFDKDILTERLGRHYTIHEVRVSPSDVGFSFLRRPRLYYVLARRGVLAVTRNIAAVYVEVAQTAKPTRLRAERPRAVTSVGVAGHHSAIARGGESCTPAEWHATCPISVARLGLPFDTQAAGHSGRATLSMASCPLRRPS